MPTRSIWNSYWKTTVKKFIPNHDHENFPIDNFFIADTTRQNTKAGDAIWGLANNGLDFLDSRTEFWRQQKPVYARKTKVKIIPMSHWQG